MNKVNKFYKAAMDAYCDGELEKALKYCDKALKMDRKHSPTLNLKGLVFYVRGNLEQAKAVWKLSYKLNRDMVSKKYVDDCKKDEADKYIFNKGVILFNDLKIREALGCFLQCELSHFNSLNLWNYLAKCYMKLGQHDKSVKYIENILSLDIKNKEALALRKELINLGVMEKCKDRKINKKFMVIPIIIVLLVGSVLGIYKGYGIVSQWLKNRENKVIEEVEEDIPNLDNFQGNTQGNEEVNIEESVEETKKESFSVDKLKEYMVNNDFEAIIKYIEPYDINELSINDRSVLQEGLKLIEEKGVTWLYNTASELIEKKEYESAIEKLQLALKYSDGVYLKEHILFMIASCYEAIGDIELSNTYYEEYVELYIEEGVYIQQCLYSLATNNKGIDESISKKYAEILSSKYVDSDFNNSVIKDILK